MRRGSDNGWLVSDNGVFMGVNLGADFCAEHEWGVRDLRIILGVPGAAEEDRYAEHKKADYGGVYGIERRRCKTPNKDCIALKEDGDTLNLIVARPYTLKNLLEHPLDNPHYGEWRFHDKQEMATAWCENSLIVRVKGEANFKKLRQIHDALLRGECAIWLGGGGVFKNAGLCIAIISTITKDNLKVMHDADVDREKLNRADEKTGIKKKIEEANDHWQKMQEVESGRSCYGKKWGFYALSPRWAGKEEKKKTKHPVVYWLNPMEQDVNNYGCFTVEELEQWLEGKGPIPKEKSKQRRRR